MIKSVLLDFGGVLFVDKDQFDGPFGNLTSNKDYWKRARVGKVDDETVFQDIADRYQTDTATVKKWLLSRREPNQPLLELFDNLEERVKTGVINNGLKTLFYDYLDMYDLTDRFDVLVQSAEIGMEKPDQRIYLHACDSLRLSPQECLFIDDEDSNVTGAEAVGMKAFNIHRIDVGEELKKLNLLK